jgi:hypothetical protein
MKKSKHPYPQVKTHVWSRNIVAIETLEDEARQTRANLRLRRTQEAMTPLSAQALARKAALQNRRDPALRVVARGNRGSTNANIAAHTTW